MIPSGRSRAFSWTTWTCRHFVSVSGPPFMSSAHTQSRSCCAVIPGLCFTASKMRALIGGGRSPFGDTTRQSTGTLPACASNGSVPVDCRVVPAKNSTTLSRTEKVLLHIRLEVIGMPLVVEPVFAL